MHLPPLPPMGSLSLRRTLKAKNAEQSIIDAYIGGGGNIPSPNVINTEWPFIKDFYEKQDALTSPDQRERYNTVNNIAKSMNPNLHFRATKSPKKAKKSAKKAKKSKSPKKAKKSPKKTKTSKSPKKVKKNC